MQTLTPESGLARWTPIFPPVSPPTGRYVQQLRHCYTTTEWPELSMSPEGAYQPEDEGLNGRHGGLGFL